ncbi:MAG: putative ATP-binding protein involved in virulence [Planctomycetaceae bacterium]|nr:putative ATP-binding protein involved in virulence [Planctomycetaceae bacterium]
MNTPTTRLDKLELENFRCFSKIEISLHEKLTVIVAVNGGGKTTVLDAACFGWQFFLQGIELEQSAKTIREADVRRTRSQDGAMVAIKPVSLSGSSLIAGESVKWNVDKGQTAPKNTSSRAAESMRDAGRVLRLATQDYADQKIADPPTLPAIGYYGTGRLWSAQKITKARRKYVKADNSPTSGYDQCLSPSSHFAIFEVWFERYSREAQQERISEKQSPHKPADKLKAVVNAVDALLKPVGWHSLAFDFTDETIVAEHPVHGRLPVSTLSDGIRVIIGLVGDIAHRCVRLNPHFGSDAAKLTPGVIMIDEVDMHLHPEWQQLVLAALTEAFPLIQFIVTTHSPQVLTTVKRTNIRALIQDTCGIWSADIPNEETKGVESSTAMNDVMGVNQVPPVPEAGWRYDYTAMIENGDHETTDGLELRTKLAAHYGEQHPIILDFDRLIRFQAFKRRRPQPSE